MSEEAKPARKIKPPSASFLKSREIPPSTEGPAVPAATPAPTPEVPAAKAAEPEPVPAAPAPAPSAEGLLGAPSTETAPDDQELFAVPEPEPTPAPAAPAPVAADEPEKPAAEPAESTDKPAPAPLSEAGIAERLQAELRELRDIVNTVDSLSYLRARLNRAAEEGADSLTLVSFYRLVVRSLNEQADHSRRDYETMRSKANKLELELAASSISSEPGESKAVAVPTGISGEAQSRIDQLEQELASANEQREKLLLDFKNMRERTQKDLNIQLFNDKVKFFKRFLPVLDSFERAQSSFSETSSATSMFEGFQLISNQLNDALAGEGLEAIPTDCLFDPRIHEAVGEVQNEEKPDDYCYDELSRGYKLGERLIRPAMVRISRNSGSPPPPAGEAES